MGTQRGESQEVEFECKVSVGRYAGRHARRNAEHDGHANDDDASADGYVEHECRIAYEHVAADTFRTT